MRDKNKNKKIKGVWGFSLRKILKIDMLYPGAFFYRKYHRITLIEDMLYTLLEPWGLICAVECLPDTYIPYSPQDEHLSFLSRLATDSSCQYFAILSPCPPCLHMISH